MERSWGVGKESKVEASTQEMVGKDDSRLFTNSLTSEALLGGNRKLNKVYRVHSLCIHLYSMCTDVI